MSVIAVAAGTAPASTTALAASPTSATTPALLAELDTPLLRHLRIGYVRAGTLNALRAAALIREEIESRGEALL